MPKTGPWVGRSNVVFVFTKENDDFGAMDQAYEYTFSSCWLLFENSQVSSKILRSSGY